MRSLLVLLGDEDPGVVDAARRALVELGVEVVPMLREHLDRTDLTLKLRIRDVISQITSPSLPERFRRLGRDARADELDLEEALFTVARLGDDPLRPFHYRHVLDALAEDIRPRLPADPRAAPGRVVYAVNHVLFSKYGFDGDRETYYRPANSYLHRVLERRRGIPLSLSSLVLLVARRLDLPYRGVALPGHFLVSYPVRDRRIFLDVFNRGTPLNRDQCLEFIRAAGVQSGESCLRPATTRRIVERFLHNLVHAFRRQERPGRVRAVRHLLSAFRSSSRP